MPPVPRRGSESPPRSRLAVGTGVARVGGGVLVTGDGEGDNEPFRRLRRRTERSDSGVCFGGASKVGLGLSRA